MECKISLGLHALVMAFEHWLGYRFICQRQVTLANAGALRERDIRQYEAA